MQFNDGTNYSGIINDVDFLLFGDGSTFNSDYSLVDRTRNINIVYDEAVAELFKSPILISFGMILQTQTFLSQN